MSGCSRLRFCLACWPGSSSRLAFSYRWSEMRLLADLLGSVDASLSVLSYLRPGWLLTCFDLSWRQGHSFPRPTVAARASPRPRRSAPA